MGSFLGRFWCSEACWNDEMVKMGQRAGNNSLKDSVSNRSKPHQLQEPSNRSTDRGFRFFYSKNQVGMKTTTNYFGNIDSNVILRVSTPPRERSYSAGRERGVASRRRSSRSNSPSSRSSSPTNTVIVPRFGPFDHYGKDVKTEKFSAGKRFGRL